MSLRAAPEPYVFTAVFFAYVLFAAAGVTWMDSGELAHAAYNLGGSHPPGHPGHALLGKLATLMPVGEIAFRLNLLSAAAAAAAVAGAVRLSRTLVPDQPVAAGAGAALAALSPAALENATRTEVYAPAAALLVWSAALAVRFCRADPAARDGRLLLGSAGLAAAAAVFHPVIAASAALPILVTLALAAGRRLARLAAPAAALGLLAAATYLYLPARALAASPPLLLWGDPGSAEGWLALVTGALYRDNFTWAAVPSQFSALWLRTGEGMALGLALGGSFGLVFGSLTRLRGAALLLAASATTVLGASTQHALNPDMRGYLFPAVLFLSAGLTAAVAAVMRALPRDPEASPARRHVFSALLVLPLALAALLGRPAPDLDRTEDIDRLWDETAGVMPPGPGVYFANGDATLFSAQYERLVAGGRPDLALAEPELCRDRWFLAHLERALPELYVPFLDDRVAGQTAERLALFNLRAGRPVGAERPGLAGLPRPQATPLGRAYLYELRPQDPRPTRPPAPLPFLGRVGHRLAGSLALTRGIFEAERGRLAQAARAAGVAAELTEEQRQALDGGPRPGRPALMSLLPRMTRVFIHAPWLTTLFAEELRWRAGLEVGPPPGHAPRELELHAAWRALLGGAADEGLKRAAALGAGAERATVRMLFSVGRDTLAIRHLRATLEKRPQAAAPRALLASALANQNTPEALAEAEALLRRAAELAPDDAETRARFGVVLARRGNLEEARRQWRAALELSPGRRDVRKWLDELED